LATVTVFDLLVDLAKDNPVRALESCARHGLCNR
jgi:hypothetical protein